jgi:hypothetical protein
MYVIMYVYISEHTLTHSATTASYSRCIKAKKKGERYGGSQAGRKGRRENQADGRVWGGGG